ncbi:OB-fold nucleic acid binding domain protein [Cryptosporidium felis]|nr:OB-fold nucleic acid binding domain protein [Cryptosporidium felis]
MEADGYEWFDAVSRQQSKLSKTSFYTAKTEQTIYDGKDELKNLEFEVESSDEKQSYENHPKEMASFIFPVNKPRSKTININNTDNFLNKIRKSSSNLSYNKNRSKTTPNRKLTSCLFESSFMKRGSLFGSNSNESVKIKNVNCYSSLEHPSTDSIQKLYISCDYAGSIRMYEKTPDFALGNTGISKNINIETTSRKEQKFIYKSGIQIDKKFYLENDQSCESPEINSLLKGMKELDFLYKNNSGHKTLTKELYSKTENSQSCKNNIKETEKLFKLDLPSILIEDEGETYRVRSRIYSIFLSFLDCESACCFS